MEAKMFIQIGLNCKCNKYYEQIIIKIRNGQSVHEQRSNAMRKMDTFEMREKSSNANGIFCRRHCSCWKRRRRRWHKLSDVVFISIRSMVECRISLVVRSTAQSCHTSPDGRLQRHICDRFVVDLQIDISNDRMFVSIAKRPILATEATIVSS